MTQSAFSFYDNETINIVTSYTNYEIYHDESKKDGYWHGMLLIPTEQKQPFYNLLRQQREYLNYFNHFSFKDIMGPGEKFQLADSWLSLGIGFLRSNINKNNYVVKTCRRIGNRSNLENLPNSYIGAKFILFRVADNHQGMTYFKDKVCNIETTARMGLKGGLHFLGNTNEPIHIEKIHFDGHEHYLRSLDENRIIKKIQGLRDYCSFSKKNLIDQRSSNIKKENSQSEIDCEFLILTDLLIGAFRVALGSKGNKYMRTLARHAESILEKFLDGYARMQNSRWANSFFLSECYLELNQWLFNELALNRTITKVTCLQQPLFDN